MEISSPKGKKWVVKFRARFEMSKNYFVWRSDSTKPFRVYGIKNHVFKDDGSNPGEMFWSGESYADALRQQRKANENYKLEQNAKQDAKQLQLFKEE